MASKRKSVKSKFLSEEINEILNSSQCVNSPIKNKIPKLTHDETFKEDSKIKVSKTKRVGSHFDATQKIFNVMDHQLTKTKNSNENVLISLSDMVSQLQGDKEVLIANEQKLKQLISDLLHCIQQSKLAREQNLKKLEEVYNTYKNKFEEMYLEEKSDTKQLIEELNEDINILQDKLIADARRIVGEAMRNNIFHAMQNEFGI